jgi:hypothetical protein
MAPDKLEEKKALTCMWLAELPAGSVSLLLATSATLMPALRTRTERGWLSGSSAFALRAFSRSCGPGGRRSAGSFAPADSHRRGLAISKTIFPMACSLLRETNIREWRRPVNGMVSKHDQ